MRGNFVNIVKNKPIICGSKCVGYPNISNLHSICNNGNSISPSVKKGAIQCKNVINQVQNVNKNACAVENIISDSNGRKVRVPNLPNKENNPSCDIANSKNSVNADNVIKILALNVCNLLTKFRAPEIEEFCNTYDILCFSESKLDQYDEVEIKSFKALPPLNRKNAKRKSGGIIVFVRDFLYENVEVLKSCNENVLWFIVNDNVFEYPVLIGSVYIPPESSTYSNIDIFDVIESDLIKYTSETNCKVCLVGDFNAHTGTKSDFTQINDYVCSSVELDNIVNIVSLETLGIDVTRYNSDLSVDNYGNRLLQMCQNLELLIANGRLGKDKGIGSLTCKNSTVVDYCILSPELFTHVSAFEVLPFDPMISDIHNALHIEILCKLVDTVDNDIVHKIQMLF